MYRLVFQSGPLAGNARAIQRRRVVIGRELSNEVWLDDPDAAPAHAEIIDDAGSVRIRCVAADQTIRVNGHVVPDAILDHGDVIEIGKTSIRFIAGAGLPPGALRTMIWVGLSLATLVILGAVFFGQHIPGLREMRRNPSRPLVPRPLAPTTVPETHGLSTMEKMATNPVPPAVTGTNDAAGGPDLAEDGRLGIGGRDPTAPLPFEAKSSDFPEFVDQSADPVVDQALAVAMQAAESGKLSAADAQLAGLIEAHPECLPAYAERARILEKMGQAGKAEEVWAHLLQRAGNHPLYATAAEELARLAGRQVSQLPTRPDNPVDFPLVRPRVIVPAPTNVPPAIPTRPTTNAPLSVISKPAQTSAPPVAPSITTRPVNPPVPPSPVSTPVVKPPAPRPPVTNPPPVVVRPSTPPVVLPIGPVATNPPVVAQLPARLVRLGDIQVKRFPDSPGIHDSRIVEMPVWPVEGTQGLSDPQRITLKIEFFDRISDSNAVIPSESTVTLVRIGNSWGSTGAIQFNASYTCGDAAIRSAAARGMAPPTFYGYIVRLYYDGRLQDERRKPDNLNPALYRPVPR